MADIALTAAQIAVVFPEKAEIFDFIAAVTITAGQALYVTSAGKVDLYDSNGSGTLQFAGIALNGGGAGQAISVLKEGHVFGFTVTADAYWAPLYGSNTAGAIGQSAGGSSIIVGRVVPLTDAGNLTKVVYIQASWNVLSA
jgi:hypothetical protein